MNNLKVKHFMNSSPPSILSDVLVSDVIEVLVESRIGGTAVIDEHNEIIGFVSEHDCISKILQSSYYCDPDASVNDIMSTEIEILAPNDSIVDLAQKMLASKRQVFPIAENNQLIGIINRSMILVALKHNLDECSRNDIY